VQPREKLWKEANIWNYLISIHGQNIINISLWFRYFLGQQRTPCRPWRPTTVWISSLSLWPPPPWLRGRRLARVLQPHSFYSPHLLSYELRRKRDEYPREDMHVKMEICITLTTNTIIFHIWRSVILTSTDLLMNCFGPTTPWDNITVSKAVFIVNVIFFKQFFSFFYAIIQSELSRLSLLSGLFLIKPSQQQCQISFSNVQGGFKKISWWSTVHWLLLLHDNAWWWIL